MEKKVVNLFEDGEFHEHNEKSFKAQMKFQEGEYRNSPGDESEPQM